MTSTNDPQPDSAPQPGQVRPSAAERQAVAERLHAAVNEGRLDLSEYEQRLHVSETATATAELHSVLADLPAAAAPVEQMLVQIGEIGVTRSTVYTPVGQIPVRGSQWMVQDQWLVEQKTPTWAIVLTVVGFFCLTLLSLLFLLIKDTVYRGTVDITVTNASQHYVTRIAVQSQQQVHYIYQQVNYVRALAAG